MPTQDIAISLTDVDKRFGGLRAVKNVSMEVRAGERVSMIGTNGAGKSTLFNLIAGVFPVTAGSVSMFGSVVTKQNTAKRARNGLARTFQTSRLFEQLTAAENVFIALGGRGLGWKSIFPAPRLAQKWTRVAQLLHTVGLSTEADRRVADLSHGEQRQLELAMALAADPKILMLDEPAAGFSPAERQQLVAMLTALPADITLLLIEHDMDIALQVADRVIVMHDGSKILEGTPDEIRASQVVRDIYLGGGHA
ncbi:MAG: ABC transporter ATP-binding protein [Microbacteriaceae bacterium]|jgi:branched-chain amino acid transport system ATP-binding protein